MIKCYCLAILITFLMGIYMELVIPQEYWFIPACGAAFVITTLLTAIDQRLARKS